MNVFGLVAAAVGLIAAVIGLPKLIASHAHETRAVATLCAAGACVGLTFVPSPSRIGRYSCGTIWKRAEYGTIDIGGITGDIPLHCDYTTSYLLLALAVVFLCLAVKELVWLRGYIATEWRKNGAGER